MIAICLENKYPGEKVKAKLKLIFFLGAAVIQVTFAASPARVPITGGGQAIYGSTDVYSYSGVPWPTSRFSKITNTKCVLDKLTGLVLGVVVEGGTDSIKKEIDKHNLDKLCGYSDWRWANIVELKSLIHWGEKFDSKQANNWYKRMLENQVTDKRWYISSDWSYRKAWVINFGTYELKKQSYDAGGYCALLVRGGYREP